MQRAVVIVDPGHGGLPSFFYDLDNGVRLPHAWEEVADLEPSQKTYLCRDEVQRWKRGELPGEPRFFFESQGRKITWGDSGCLSPLDPRICEKDLVLDVARSLYGVLQGQVTFKSTRERDGYVSAESRVRLVRRVAETGGEPAVLLSLHAESSADPSVAGARIVHLPGDDPRLAETIQDALAEHLTAAGDTDLRCEVREREVEILRQGGVPGVVVELGFLSNLEDARRLLDRHRRRCLALALAEGLRRYLGLIEVRPELPLPRWGDLGEASAFAGAAA